MAERKKKSQDKFFVDKIFRCLLKSTKQNMYDLFEVITTTTT